MNGKGAWRENVKKINVMILKSKLGMPNEEGRRLLLAEKMLPERDE